ncbi:MAG: diguanylate cyclase [Acidobacteriota bacterium]
MLVLHNLNQDHPAIAAFDQGLLATFRASDRFDVRVAAEYLNVTSFEAVPSYIPETARYLTLKYAHWKPDAVSADRAVTGMFSRYLGEAFKDVPCFISQERGGAGNVAGSNLKAIPWSTTAADVTENLDLLLRLRPRTNTVLVVLGASEEERRVAVEAEKAAARYADRITFVFTPGLSHAALLKQAAELPADQAIVFLRFALDSDGISYVPAQVAREITQSARAPVFVAARHLIGDGPLGGFVLDFELVGRRTALWILDALDGREPSGESLTAPVSEYVFDWRALKRFGIPESALPPGSRVLFHNDTLWERYKPYIVSGIVLVLAEAFLILGLVINRLRRQRAEAALLALNATLEARVLERTRELHAANEHLQEAGEELEALNRNLKRLSRTDSLTGLPNRRHGEEALQDALVRHVRYGQGFAVAMADIDFFKKINDQFGHEAGDDLLRSVARIMEGGVRQCDLVARWGGEEFLLLLPGTDLTGAGRLLERIRTDIAATPLRCGATRAAVTATIGAAVAGRGDTVEGVVRRADAAMYQGKEQGRNRVVLEGEVVSGDVPAGPG